MIGNFDVGAMGAVQAAAAASSVCNEVRPCFACALEDFGRETAPQRDAERERLFKLFSVLLTQYINTFGTALLTAQGIPMTVVPDRRRANSNSMQAVEKYTPKEIARLLRGFALFYILFKVDAPDEVKDVWWSLTQQLAQWLVARGFVDPGFQLSYGPSDDEAKINAICAAGFINLAAEENESLEDAHDARHGEPFYVVSRTLPGRIWFLYSPSIGKCSEFGPVVVPPTVTNLVKPGWGFDCKFARVGTRWYISKVEDVLPL